MKIHKIFCFKLEALPENGTIYKGFHHKENIFGLESSNALFSFAVYGLCYSKKPTGLPT